MREKLVFKAGFSQENVFDVGGVEERKCKSEKKREKNK